MIEAGDIAGAITGLEDKRRARLHALDMRLKEITSLLKTVTPQIAALR